MNVSYRIDHILVSGSGRRALGPTWKHVLYRFCPKPSDLRQDIGNGDHTKKQDDSCVGADVPISRILGSNVQSFGNPASPDLSITGDKRSLIDQKWPAEAVFARRIPVTSNLCQRV